MIVSVERFEEYNPIFYTSHLQTLNWAPPEITETVVKKTRAKKISQCNLNCGTVGVS